MAETNVAQTNRIEGFERPVDFPVILEEFNRFCHRHLQNVVDGSTAPFHLKAFSSVPFSITYIAGDPHVREEVHFQFNGPTTAASLAPTTFDIETKMARFVTSLLGQLCVRKQRADFIEHFRVRSRVGPGGSTNG